MAKLQAFLSLEKSTAGTLASVWTATARKALAALRPLLEERRWDEAYDIADRLTMQGVVATHRRRLEELAVSALLFGAHHVAGKVGETSFVKGRKPLPSGLHQALDQLAVMVEQGGGEMVRNQLHALIHAEETQVDGVPAAPVSIFKAEGMTLAERLNAAVLGTGGAVIDIGANLTTSRLVTLGFLAEAVERSIDSYQVNEVLDERTCPVCEYMHGKVFEVAQEHSRVLTALGSMDPKELRSLAPWPSQTKAGLAALNSMSLGEMQAAGYGSPPYHPGCRGVLVLVGTVEERIALGQMPVDLAPVALDPDEVLFRFMQMIEEIDTGKLTAADLKIIDEYTGNAHAQMNWGLRRNFKGMASDMKKYLRDQVDLMDAALDKAELASEITVYRGVGNAEMVFEVDDLDALVGKRVRDKGFMSTTGDITVAQDFGAFKGSIMEIRVPAGVKAVVPQAIAELNVLHESEVILERGLTLKITGVDKTQKPPRIFATVLRKKKDLDSDDVVVMKADETSRFVWRPGDLQLL